MSLLKEPVFLITNDDGVYARGIHTLVRTAEKFGEVFVVAPDRERSASSHALTVTKPLHCKQEEPISTTQKVYSVDGTPVDCVKLAIKNILPRNPDFVLSGINNGSNIGCDVLYSGTIAAAMEATRHGIPALAFSGCYKKQNTQYGTCAQVVEKFLSSLDNLHFRNRVLNINVPALDFAELRGIRAAELGSWDVLEGYDEYQDPKGKKYYWLANKSQYYRESKISDYCLIDQGYVTVSVLGLDVLDKQLNQDMVSWLPHMG